VVVLALFFATSVDAAFEGFGSSTPGGSNGSRVTVTSLADSGHGTLREALASANNSRIVFAIGGTINLNSRLEIQGRGFITIDGSTAPPPGITLAGDTLYVRNSHDIIITHIRVRQSGGDGILVWDNSYNVVVDHCSVTDAADENINITEDTRNVTVSWCIIGDTRTDSFVRKSKGMLIASFRTGPVTNVSLHHNLFINQFQRSPQISSPGLFDIRNNVIRDWGAYAMRLRRGAYGNIINNVFSTNDNPGRAAVLDSSAGHVYIHGNRGPAGVKINRLGTSNNEFTVAPVTTDPVDVLEARVLREAGAFPRDSIDTLLTGPPSRARHSSAALGPKQKDILNAQGDSAAPLNQY
jgi:pectate lyase